MRKILISINPIHFAKILSGEKKYEYRTKIAKKGADSLIIYETAPTKMVVAEAKIIEVLELTPEKMWEQTHQHSDISKEFFDSYFEGREVAYAYHLGEVKAYDTPKPLSFYGIKCAPQSFVYLNA